MAQLMTCFVHDPAFFGGDLDKIAAARMPRASRPDVEHRATFSHGDPLSFPPELLATIDIPVLVVHGANDRIMPVAAGEYFAEHLPNSEFHVFGEVIVIEPRPAGAAPSAKCNTVAARTLETFRRFGVTPCGQPDSPTTTRPTSSTPPASPAPS